MFSYSLPGLIDKGSTLESGELTILDTPKNTNVDNTVCPSQKDPVSSPTTHYPESSEESDDGNEVDEILTSLGNNREMSSSGVSKR